MNKELHMEESKRMMYSAKQVSEVLGISVSYAYKIIDRLNKELIKSGYLVIPGKIDSQYLQNRFFPPNTKAQDYTE